MEYKIYDKEFEFSGECGIYKTLAIGHEYAFMDKRILVNTINSLPREEAIRCVNALRSVADQQLKEGRTPQPLGAPLVRQVPSPEPFENVKSSIENTRYFCDRILEALGS